MMPTAGGRISSWFFDVDYYYERSVENALDPAHNEFVHPKQGAPGMMLDFKESPIQIDPIGRLGGGFMIPFTQIVPEGGLLDESINGIRTSSPRAQDTSDPMQS